VQRYIAGRILQSLITLLVVSVIVFALGRMLGNPLDVLLPLDASPELRQQETERLGLNEPFFVQYGLFIRELATGDLGTSIRSKQPVSELLMARLPDTLQLVGLAMAIALLVGFPLGVLAATRKGGIWDLLIRVIALFGQSIPSFWGGIMLILVFSVHFELLPVGRNLGFQYTILPAVTIAFFGFITAGLVRLLRASMIETLDSEYVKFARIKGASERVVVWKHALKNALIPVVTFLGFYFGIIIAGSVVVETVFAWPGVGRLAFEAVQWRDYPVIQGVVLMISGFILVSTLAVDILYAYLDPRIRFR
jgi:peptide/nickel transport system permease protein